MSSYRIYRLDSTSLVCLFFRSLDRSIRFSRSSARLTCGFPLGWCAARGITIRTSRPRGKGAGGAPRFLHIWGPKQGRASIYMRKVHIRCVPLFFLYTGHSPALNS